MDHRTVGVIGGDETSRLLVEAGHRLGVRLAVLDKGMNTFDFFTSIPCNNIRFMNV
jgi:phosphoribosylaminoimidazole carboxylase (NCAIR synthetase)